MHTEEVLPQKNMTALLKCYLFLSLLDVLGFVHLNIFYWKVEILPCCFFFLITDQWLGREEKSVQWRGACVYCKRIVLMHVRGSREKTTGFRSSPSLFITPLRIVSILFWVLAPWYVRHEMGTVHAKRMITAQTDFQVCGFIIQTLVRKTFGIALFIHTTYLIDGLLLLISGSKVSLGPWKGSHLDSVQCQGLKDWSTRSLTLGRLYWLVWWTSLLLWFYSGWRGICSNSMQPERGSLGLLKMTFDLQPE